MEGFSEALAQGIGPLGIKLTIVEQGGFCTDWAGSSMTNAEPIKTYDQTVGMLRDYLEAHAGREPGDPVKAAKVIIRMVEAGDAPLRLALGNDALAILRNGYKSAHEELERCASTSSSTDFDGLDVSDTVRPQETSLAHLAE